MRSVLIASMLGLAACASPGGPAIPADVRGEAVAYRHGDTELEGYLAWDAARTGPRPGVVVVHEWRGHNDYARSRARQLAALGYVAFAIDMYGKGVYAKDHADAAARAGAFKKDRPHMRARARAGYDVLAKHPLCDPARVAALGYCFGGTTVLELARSGAPLVGAASFHGDLSTAKAEDAKAIRGQVIAFHGAEDPHYKDDHVLAFMNEMRAAKVDYQVVFFGGAVHSFTVTDAGSDPSKGSAYDPKADARSWAMLEDFLREVF